MKTRLTLEILNNEFASWINQFGENRNKSDIRFGQHIHNTYDISNIFPVGPEGYFVGGSDGFSTEATTNAYIVISARF